VSSVSAKLGRTTLPAASIVPVTIPGSMTRKPCTSPTVSNEAPVAQASLTGQSPSAAQASVCVRLQ